MSEVDKSGAHVSSTPMDTETLAALRGSIAKWEKIVLGTGLNSGPYNCPLCIKFNSMMQEVKGPVRCVGCPVHTATGKHACQGTPYDRIKELEDTDGDTILDYESQYKHAAVAELDFLKSLLPKEAA